MEINIQEDPSFEDPKITIQCRKINQDILDIVARLQTYNKKITGNKEDGTFIIDAKEIYYIDTVDKKTFFYTKDAVYETPLKLYELEEQLQDIDFFRASKSSIINFHKIKSLRPDFGGKMLIQMKNGETLYVSRQYTPVLKQKLGL